MDIQKDFTQPKNGSGSEDKVDDALMFEEDIGKADSKNDLDSQVTLSFSRKISLKDSGEGDAELIPIKPLNSAREVGVHLYNWNFNGIWDTTKAYVNREQFWKEVLSGITVALALVPEAVAFSFVAKVEPSVGLTAAWIICVLTSWLGGRPGMISAATGSMAAVMPPFVDKYGEAGLFYAVMICGVIEILLGVARAGSLMCLIPESVMIGFCNGLAIVIGLAQKELFHEGHEKPLVTGSVAICMTIEVLLTMLVVHFLPYVPKIGKLIPSSLAGIVLIMAIEFAIVRPAFDVETPVVEDFASLGGEFPIPVWLNSDYDMPDLFDGDYFGDALYLGVTLACIGLIESLMTLKLIDEITNTKGLSNKECIGQGIANLVTGILGGMGGCAMIGQSMINMNAGARERLSSTVAGIFLLIIILAAYPLINFIPTSSLAGVMFMVVIETFEWPSLRLVLMAALPQTLRERISDEKLKVRRADALVILLVTVVTLVSNLAIAVFVGIILSCILYVWEQKEIEVEIYLQKGVEGCSDTKIYNLKSPLLFSSATSFQELFNPDNDPKNIEIHFHQGAVSDYTALHTLSSIDKRYARAGKHAKFVITNVKSVRMVQKATGLLKRFEVEEKLQEIAVSEVDPLLNVQKRGRTGSFHSPSTSAVKSPEIGLQPIVEELDEFDEQQSTI
jgi:SulP family sulfate permease